MFISSSYVICHFHLSFDAFVSKSKIQCKRWEKGINYDLYKHYFTHLQFVMYLSWKTLLLTLALYICIGGTFSDMSSECWNYHFYWSLPESANSPFFLHIQSFFITTYPFNLAALETVHCVLTTTLIFTFDVLVPNLTILHYKFSIILPER